MKHVIVTGGAGYVGSHACKALAQRGYLPIVLDNLSRGHREAVKWGPLEVGDIQEHEWLRRMLGFYEPVAVMHFAAYAYVGESVRFPQAYYRNNVHGTLCLLEVMRELGLDNLVFSSTCATYGRPHRTPIYEGFPQEPINPYGWSKLLCERMILDFGFHSMILRYFNAAGTDPDGEIGEDHDPEPHLIPNIFRAATGDIPALQVHGDSYGTLDGTCIRDYVHVSDIAEAHCLALESLLTERKSGIYNLCNEAGYSVYQILAAAERVCGKEIPYEVGPPRDGDPVALVGASSNACHALGWSPKHSDLDTILSTAWAWHQRKSNAA